MELRGFYEQISNDNSHILRSIAIKKHRFKGKITFCKPSEIGSKTTVDQKQQSMLLPLVNIFFPMSSVLLPQEKE